MKFYIIAIIIYRKRVQLMKKIIIITINFLLIFSIIIQVKKIYNLRN